nr:MAG TPA: hypothetical protein [Caudoviricetes sp.]
MNYNIYIIKRKEVKDMKKRAKKIRLSLTLNLIWLKIELLIEF